MENLFVLDTECNGFIFEADKMWCLVCYDVTKQEHLILTPFEDVDAKEKLNDFLFSRGKPTIIFHNGLGYDVFVLRKLLDIDTTVGPDTWEGKPVSFIDTYYLSMFLNPDREGNSLEYFGGVLGFNKIDYRQELINLGVLERSASKGDEFMTYHPLMKTYCQRDVDVTHKTLLYLLKEWKEVYSQDFDKPSFFRCGQKTFYLQQCQALTGWKFDVDKARTLHTRISIEMDEIEKRVEPQLPARPLNKTEQKQWTLPKNPHKKDGSLSAVMVRWAENHDAVLLGEASIKVGDVIYSIEGEKEIPKKIPMKIGNQSELKDWLMAEGWEPTLWNYKKKKNGEFEVDPRTRKPVKTSPKLQDKGELCPNLQKLNNPIVKDVILYMSLRNRRSVLEGWLADERLSYDGRLSGSSRGIAASHRQRHKTIANIPKAADSVLLGKEFRELFCCDEDKLIAAADASGLENRVAGHYTFKYDGGKMAREMMDGDIHSKNTKVFFDHIPFVANTDINSPSFDKNNKEWSEWRGKSKAGNYCVIYGGGAATLASTLNIPEKMGKKKLDAYWEANPALASLRDAVERHWKLKGQEKYLPAIDGRILRTRKQNALLNNIFQSCGAVIMDIAGCLLDQWLGDMYWDDKMRPYYKFKGSVVRRICYYHK